MMRFRGGRKTTGERTHLGEGRSGTKEREVSGVKRRKSFEK